jgi:beta-lactamase regulating signal transducer with metallopeptidase domain
VSKVDVSVRSPAGGLQLSSGEVEVRSTATSVVGIVLSLGAVVVLVVWWIRTSRKRRALRRDQEAEDAGTPAGVR